MFAKILHKLSKKASRKNLYNFIQLSFESELSKNKDIKVLNIGSGGEIEELIKQNFKNVFSIDVDEKRSPNQILDLCDDNFKNKINVKPSLVCCFEVLEHTSNPIKAIKNVYEILDKNNYFLASVPFNFHIHDEPNDFFRFTYHGLVMLFKDFSEVKIKKRNGWLESLFVNFIRLEKEKNILSKIIGKTFILLYFILLPLIIIIQKFITSEKLTTGYYIEAKK
jgi:SAM-dependent methyltransferase